MKRTVIAAGALLALFCSPALAERPDCDTGEGNGACFGSVAGNFLCTWDDEEDLDDNGIVDHFCIVSDGLKDFSRFDQKGKFFYHGKEKDGYLEYCPFPFWEWTPDRADECYYGTADSTINYWWDPAIDGWAECPAVFDVQGFATHADGSEVAVDSRWQTKKNRGECVLQKFWIHTVP